MRFVNRSVTIRATLVLTLIAATACTPMDRRDGQYPLAQRAEALAAEGQYQEAASAYVKLAQSVQAQARTRYLLRAAELFLDADAYGQARSVLDRLERDSLQSRDAIHFDLIAAELALERAAPAQALAYLVWEIAQVPPQWQVRYRRLRARALVDDGQFVAAARERIALTRLIDAPALARDNRQALFSTLLRMPADAMQRELQPLPGDDPLRGWLALAYLVKTRLFEGEPMDQALTQWRQQYPGHPAGEVLAGRIVQRYHGAFEYPRQLALVLPLSGRYAFAAEAIRNGFFMAYYTDAGERPRVRIYDTGGTAQGAVEAYRQAVFEGAGWVIGPLDKQAVGAVLSMPQRAVPVLALNYPEASLVEARGNAGTTTVNESVEPVSRFAPAYQFGLMPEQEARQVAAKMLADGHRRVLALVPQDEWGQRMLHAFVQRFTELGGYVADVARFALNRADHSATIQSLLGLSAGTQRARALEQGLGRNLEYVPHPRDDADALFLAAHPEQARLIKPQLRFYEATDLPVYGTSHLYAGVPQPGEDIDLNGIVFSDAPWILGISEKGPPRDAMRSLFPAAGASAGRLYALGADAYRVIPYLPWLADHPRDHYPGLSGRLSVDEQNQLHRRLAWAQFRHSVPEVVDQALPSLQSRRWPAPDAR